MVYAVTTQTLPRWYSLSHCHRFHGTRVNVILLSLNADLLYRISQNSVKRYGKYGIRSFTSLIAAFLTAFMFRNSHSKFLWTSPTLNFIQNERKYRNCRGGLRYQISTGSLKKCGKYGEKFTHVIKYDCQ